MVAAANHAAQVEEVGTEMWASVEYAAAHVGRSVKTIRTWVNRGRVAEACLIAGRRLRFVSLDDVRARHAEAKKPRGRVA